MDALAEKLASQIRLQYPGSEANQLQVVNLVMAKLAVKTHIQKLHGGGMAELVACTRLGLAWENENARGADARNAAGQAVELKTMEILAKSKGCNVNYVYPKGVNVVKHYAESPEYVGGHYWVGMNKGKTEVLWYVHLTQAAFARLVSRRLKENSEELRVNFGSTLCKRCRRCPRIDALAGLPKCCA